MNTWLMKRLIIVVNSILRVENYGMELNGCLLFQAFCYSTVNRVGSN